ncbi:hypothetical protein PMKS-001850 [Pichia membranifaciens]|uniref:Pre-rRNA-processing protein ESF2 n=1 Tax=Pichia membranifaciens TaxID=4926 RepID=A0A1Q2YFR1_9ASCO|nr:hypothetical protein PMKS-001850 [Pichia membranifaciens]
MAGNSGARRASESEDDFHSSGDDSSGKFTVKNTKKPFDIYGETGNESEDQQEEDDSDDDSDDAGKSVQRKSTKSFVEKAQDNSDSDNNGDDDDDEEQYYGFLGDEDGEALDNADAQMSIEETAKVIEKKLLEDPSASLKKVKRLTPKQLENEEKRVKKTGVVYLSSLPPYMKPQKLRQVMTRFGEVGRIFLKPEDPKVYKSRIKSGGNKKKKFDEGWVEFVSKSDAKLAASTLNGNVLGGKKRSFYHDDVMNVKYLKGFKWFDLTNALNREVEVRESKKQAELSQANKLNKAYVRNVETSKTINRIKESKKRKLPDGAALETPHIRREFKQRNVATNRAGADDSIKNRDTNSALDSVLNKIF